MAKKLSEMRSTVRAFISEDTEDTVLDTEINDFLNDTLSDLAGTFFLTKRATITRVSMQEEYTLPDRVLGVISVFVGAVEFTGFTKWSTFQNDTDFKRYYYFGNTIVFNQDPGANATVFYQASFDPYDILDDDSVSDVPVYLEPLVAMGATIRAYRKLVLLVSKNKNKYPDIDLQTLKEALQNLTEEYEESKKSKLDTGLHSASAPFASPFNSTPTTRARYGSNRL